MTNYKGCAKGYGIQKTKVLKAGFKKVSHYYKPLFLFCRGDAADGSSSGDKGETAPREALMTG